MTTTREDVAAEADLINLQPRDRVSLPALRASGLPTACALDTCGHTIDEHTRRLPGRGPRLVRDCTQCACATYQPPDAAMPA